MQGAPLVWQQGVSSVVRALTCNLHSPTRLAAVA